MFAVISRADAAYTSSMEKQTFAGYVQARRWELKLSQDGLAKAAGKPITRGYLGQLERGFIKRPGREHLAALARGLDVSVEDLVRAMGMLPGAAHETGVDDDLPHLNDRVRIGLRRARTQMPDDDYERLVATIESQVEAALKSVEDGTLEPSVTSRHVDKILDKHLGHH